jgi:hypothetical protein
MKHKKYIEQHNNKEECGPCPVFAGFTLAFALQMRKKYEKTSVRAVIHKHTVSMLNIMRSVKKGTQAILTQFRSSFY